MTKTVCHPLCLYSSCLSLPDKTVQLECVSLNKIKLLFLESLAKKQDNGRLWNVYLFLPTISEKWINRFKPVLNKQIHLSRRGALTQAFTQPIIETTEVLRDGQWAAQKLNGKAGGLQFHIADPGSCFKVGSHLPDAHIWVFSSLLLQSFTQGTARRPHCTLHLTCGATDQTCQLCKICSPASEIPLPSEPFALCLKSLVSPGHHSVQTCSVRPISIKEANWKSSQCTRETSQEISVSGSTWEPSPEGSKQRRDHSSAE